MANILIIDDDLQLSLLVAHSMQLEGHVADVMHTILEGWNAVEAKSYDLILLDWDLPDGTGIDLLKRLRESGGTMPVIMLTGHSSISDKKLGFECGANDYLTKPFHPDELSARVGVALRHLNPPKPMLKSLGSNNKQVLERGNLKGTALAAKYEFLEIIGAGSFSLVFKARHPLLEKLLAIKMLDSTNLNEQHFARFDREAKVISRLEHPNIIALYDFGITEHNQRYLVMEFVDGKDLGAILEEVVFLPLKPALEIMLPVCDAIAHAHEKGILHRDVKPENIMLRELANRTIVPKVLDFGLARMTHSEQQSAIAITQAGLCVGSPAYMSPEQIKCKHLDERTDVYSLGCTIFEVLTGYLPFEGDTTQEIFIKHLQDPPPSFADICPQLALPEELEVILRKSMEREPGQRHQSVRELRFDLEKIARNFS